MSKDDDSTVVAEYKQDQEVSITCDIVRGIAAVEGADPTRLEFSLYNYVDLDALEKLINHSSNPIKIRFKVNDYKVVLVDSDTIRILDSK